uniref:Titin n=1 Tax=Periophthalmus magnuspinnatus TaxID=409849 RepID=A0A3B4ABM2_9GOBI
MSDHCTLAWAQPTLDGGAPITHYTLEKRETSRLSWTVVAPKIDGLFYKVKNLLPSEEYIFRVRGVNKYGVGDFLESEPIVARNPYKPPSAPGTPEASEITKDSMLLSWSAPENTGGAEIQGYHLEKRDKDSVRWTKCNREKLLETSFRVTGLMTDHFYEYRVAAENEAGMGDMSELSLLYRACNALTPPGPPHHPKVIDYSKTSVSLSWGKPSFDGGAYVKGYIVEMREYTPIPEETEEAEVAPAVEPVVEKEWSMCTPPTGIQATKLTITDLKEGGEYQFRVCAINSEGVGEAANVHGTVVTSSRAEAPEMELDAELRKVVSVRAGGTLRLFVTIRGRPEPTVKWEKVEGTLTDRSAIDTTSSYTMLVIDNVNRFDSGKYSLTLENSSGSKSAVVAVRILDTPSAPQKFAVKELKKDSITLAWDTPLTDGGSKITNYIVEKRESVRKVYTTVTSNCTANSFKIEDLPEGGTFYFRVCAVNEYGEGQKAETKEIKISEVPLPPNKVTVVDQTKTSVSLAWEKPAHDGGSKVMCYNVEFKPKSGDKWGTACTVKVPEAKVANLTPNEAYLFRVVAINEKGKSEPKDLGLPVIAKDIDIEPSVNLLFTAYSVKAKDDLTIEVPVRGRPKPVISWKKDGLPLKQTSSVTVLNTATSSKIMIKEASHEHMGKYEITLANSGGTISTDITVVVLDKPGPPKAIKVDLATKSFMIVTWNEPVNDGGSPVLGYHLERKERTSILWTKMNRGMLKNTEYKVSGVDEGMMYEYRVYAENIAGIGKCSKACEAVAARDPCDPPGMPVVTAVTRSSVSLSWDKPEYDGGAKVSGYVIERRDLPEGRWTRCNFTNVAETHYDATGLTENSQYDFRVIAKNAAGLFSEPSDNTGPITVKDDVDPPRIMMDVKYRETVKVKAGETLRISADLAGRPAPVVSWTKDGKEIELRARIQIVSTDTSTAIVVKDCIRRDSGQYVLTLQNIAGTVTMPINCVVMDKPGPCAGPLQITGLTAEACTLSWGPPQEAGGAEITHYYREYFTVSGLKTDAQYEFCVKAINKIGPSARSPYSEPAAAMDRTCEPAFDVDIEMRKVLMVKHNAAFTLNVPFSGNPAPTADWAKEGVDLKPKVSLSRNNVAIKASDKRLTAEVTPDSVVISLTEATSKDAGKYEITASNAGGTTKISFTFVVMDKPGPPIGPVEVGEVGETSVFLKWTPPEYDGGSPVTHYMVLKRETSTPAWTEVTTNVARSAIKATKLTKGEEYQFRIKAVNRYGISDHIDSKSVMIKLPYSE